MSGSNKAFRFDVANLNTERLKLFIERLELVTFLTQSGMPKGKIVYIDAFFDAEPDLNTLLNGFEDVRFIDYSHVPYAERKYPFW